MNMLRKEASMYQASQKWLSMYSQVGYWSEGPSTYGIALWLRLLKENEKQQEADICALPLYFLHFKLISLAVCERRYVWVHTCVRAHRGQKETVSSTTLPIPSRQDLFLSVGHGGSFCLPRLESSYTQCSSCVHHPSELELPVCMGHLSWFMMLGSDL